MTKTIWVDTTGASTTYVPREKPIQESVAPFSGTISGAAPATTNLGTNSGQRILAADGTWIPQPAFTSGGADQLETLRPSVISPSYSANPPTVTDSAKAYDVDTNHATTFGQWYAAQEARTNNRVDIFSLTTWASKTQTWTAATINVSRSYAILQDGESSATSGSSSKTSSVKYEFSTNNGSSWTTLGTDTAASIPTAPQTLSMALGSLTPTMGNILVKVTITRGGGGTIYEDGFSLPGLTGEIDLKLFDVWIDGTYAGGAGNITCNNLTVTGDATFQNKIYDSTASAGTTGQVLKVAANGKVTWATDSAGTGTVTSITTTGANGVTISGGSTQTITTSGTFALALGNITPTSISTGTGSFSGDVEFAASIKSPNGSNSPVTIVPDGTGDLHVNADSLRLGDNNADATIATNGTGDLILTTHEGSATQGVIRLYDGANGNITLTPNGTGQVQVGSDQVVTLTASQTLTNKTLSTSSVWNGNTIGVAYGGTGSITLTSGSYVVGNGTSAVTLKTPTQVTADLDTFTYQIGATAGKKGLVPAAPAIGASVVYLDQTGSWTTPSGSGTTTNALTIQSPLTGTSFNGSTAVTIALGSGYGDTQNPYGSKTANYFLAAPNGTAGSPTFRAIVAADIPTLNQNTTGTAANITASSNTTLTTLSSLVSIGTITTGTWNASAIGVAYGGTGLTTLTAGYIPYGNGTSAFGSSANLFWDSTNSRLGIGTTSPSTYGDIALYRAATGLATIAISQQNASTNDGAKFSVFYQGTEIGNYGYYWDGGQFINKLGYYGVLTFNSNSSEQMRLTSTGLGIGTNSPAQKLDINGKLRFTPNTADTNYSADIYANYNSTHPFQLDVKNNGSTAEYLGVYADGGGSNNRVVFPTGNVGIGITSPSAKLSIYKGSAGVLATLQGGGTACGFAQGVVGGANTFEIQTQDATTGTLATRYLIRGATDNANHEWYAGARGSETAKMFLNATSGNLGIGTIIPYNLLEATKSGGATISIANSSSGAGIMYGKLSFYSTDAAGSYSEYGGQIRSYSGVGIDYGDLRFYTGNGAVSTERMRITSGGDVLVNATATADSSKLYVAGNLGTNGNQFNFRPGSGTQYELVNRIGAGFDFYVNNAGTLAVRIDSSGNVKASGVLLGNNGTKGYGAITTTTSTSTPTGGSSGDHYYIY